MGFIADYIKYHPENGFSENYENPDVKLIKAVKKYFDGKLSRFELDEINKKHDKHFKIKEMVKGSRIGSILYFTNNKLKKRIPGIVIDFNNDIVPTKERCLDDGWEIIYEKPWISGDEIGIVTLLSEYGTFEIPQQQTSGYGGTISVIEHLITVDLALKIRDNWPLGHIRVEFETIISKVLSNASSIGR